MIRLCILRLLYHTQVRQPKFPTRSEEVHLKKKTKRIKKQLMDAFQGLQK